MNEQAMKRLSELARDKSFIQALKACQSNEETLKTLERFGVSISAEELTELLKAVPPEGDADGELSEDSLEDVAGGVGLRMTGAWKAAIPLIPRLTPLLPIIRWTY